MKTKWYNWWRNHYWMALTASLIWGNNKNGWLYLKLLTLNYYITFWRNYSSQPTKWIFYTCIFLRLSLHLGIQYLKEISGELCGCNFINKEPGCEKDTDGHEYQGEVWVDCWVHRWYIPRHGFYPNLEIIFFFLAE